MKISTRLRLLSMKKGIKGEVASLILKNTKTEDPIEIARWMKDVANNGLAYSAVDGLQYGEDFRRFHKRHEQDIQIVMIAYRIQKGIIVRQSRHSDVEEVCIAFDEALIEIMDTLKLGHLILMR